MQTTLEKYRTLVERLTKATLNNKLKWSIHAFTDELYCSLAKFKVVLEEGEDAEGSSLIIVRVKDEDDNQIDVFNDNTINGPKPMLTQYSTYWALMADLYNLARRNAVGADKALDQVLGNLPPVEEDDVPF
jgi:hypothetical protein